MKNQWMAYVIVALLAIGAGVAIAGLPDNAPVEATIVTPTTAAVSGTTVAPETTEPTETTEAGSDTTASPETTEPTETTEAGSDTTAAPETTDATDSVPGALPERSEVAVGVANGSGVAGAAARNIARLTDVGYVDLAGFDGTEIVEFTTIYFADGFEEAADRLALDLDLLPIFVARLADAPPVDRLTTDIELLAYIGIDRA